MKNKTKLKWRDFQYTLARFHHCYMKILGKELEAFKRDSPRATTFDCSPK